MTSEMQSIPATGSAELQKLLILADEEIARQIINRQHLYWAKARVRLFERKELHMCRRSGCRNQVAGKNIFTLCESHLRGWERDWFQEQIEGNTNWMKSECSEESDPVVRQVNIIRRDRTLELVRQNVQLKERLLSEAYKLIEDHDSKGYERYVFLPNTFRLDLNQRWEMLIAATGVQFVDPYDEEEESQS